MKRIGLSVVLILTIIFSLTVPAMGVGPYTVDFIGQEKELKTEELKNGQKIDVEVKVYTNADVDRFDAAHLLLTYDSAVFRFVRGRTSDEGYDLMAQEIFGSGGHCSLMIMNLRRVPPAADRYCCTCTVTLEITDAEALLQAGRKVLSISPWRSDVNLTAGGDSYRLRSAPDVMEVDCTPIIVTAEGNKGEEQSQQTVSFNPNGPIKMEDMEVPVGGTVELPEPEREGYTFEGWHTDVKLTEPVSGTTYTPEGDEVLYAKWEEIPATDWVIQFVENGGEDLAPVKVEKGTTAKLPVPVKEGSEFLGWYTDATLLHKAEDTYQPGENTMLYAKWKTVYNAAPSPDGSGTDVQQGDAPAATALTDTKDGDRSSVAAAGTDGQQFPVLLVVLLVVVAAAVICIAVAVVQRKKKTK